MQISPCIPKSQERKSWAPWSKVWKLAGNLAEESLPRNASWEGLWACSNRVNSSNGKKAGFQGFFQLACLAAATVLRLKVGSFSFLLCQGFCGMGLGSSPFVAASWTASWSAPQLSHLKRVKINHFPDFPSVLASLILFFPQKTNVWSRAVN